MRKYLMESVGTFVLVIVIGLTNDAIAIGAVLAAMIAGGMQISGAHFNPAISFAFFLRKKINTSTFLGYSFSQILGAFAGSGVLLMMANNVFYIEPPISTNLYQQSFIELFLSFILVFGFISLISSSAGKTSKINALLIGVLYTGLFLTGTDLSGSIMNPALSIGSSMVDFLAIRGRSFEYIPLYTLAPLSGSAIAAFLYRYLYD